MQKNIQFNKEENCFLVNNKIKIDTEYIENLQGKKNLNKLIKKDDNLYYYTDKSLIELLFNNTNFETIIFKNNDSDDYRLNNLTIIDKKKIEFNKLFNVIILKYGKPKLITLGAEAGEEKNMYWKVKNELFNKEYYIMHINDETYIKFSIKDKNKILDFNGERPMWFLRSSGYIATKMNNRTVYLHLYLMDVHFKDDELVENIIYHLNCDKLDNRHENLRYLN